MRRLRSLLFRLQPLFRRRQIEAELADELRSHLEFATEAHLAAGLSPADARRAAERELGGLEQIKESYRDQRSLPWLDQLQQDLRAAFRSLRKTPGFTAVAVLSLAVAIGVATTVFSLVNGLLLRPLAPLRPAEIVALYVADVKSGDEYRPFTHAEYLALRSARDTFADVAATQITLAGVADDQGVHRGAAQLTSENYFSLLGVQPALGRFFTPEECRPGANLPVVVASYASWQRLGGRPDFVGRTVRLNGRPYTVVGVAPAGFVGLSVLIATDFWAPLGVFTSFGGSAYGVARHDLALPTSQELYLTARLAPGVTLASLNYRLPALAQQLPALSTSASAAPRKLVAAIPSRQNNAPFPTDDTTVLPLAFGLLAIAGSVLLIASFNLGNMSLARGADRARELALRSALGASRGRIVRQLLTEGLLVASAGGVAGFGLSLWANHLLLASASAPNASLSTFALNLQPDGRVLLATCLCCLVATLVFSVVPAFRSSRIDLVRDLKQTAGDARATTRLNRFFAPRHLLLMTQVALSLPVLFSACLFVRSAVQAENIPLGFDPSGRLVVELDYTLRNTPADDEVRSISAAVERLRALPGVTAVAASTRVPYANLAFDLSVQAAPGQGASDASFETSSPAVTPGYLDALGVRLLRGRDFTAAEARGASSPPVAIIDESLARRLFPNGDAIGRRIREAGQREYSRRPGDGLPPEREIVGLCSSHRHSLWQQNPAAVYVPFAQSSGFKVNTYLLVSYGQENPATTVATLESLRTALRALDPDLPIVRIVPFDAFIERHIPLWMARLGSTLFAVFGAIALLLAVIGVYGVKSYAVARRTREIGIRLALGASPRTAFALIFRQALLQIALALGVGAALAFAAGRLLGSFVYRISGTDPLALAAAALLLATATLAACWLPARRATRVDPMIALRCE